MTTTIEAPGLRTAVRATPRFAHLARLAPLIGPAVFLAAWSVLSVVFADSVPKVLPTPWSAAARVPAVWRADLLSNVAASAEVAAGGWFAGGLGAVVLGVLLARVRAVGDVVTPVIELLRPISALAWVPLAVIWFGIGYSSKLFVVSLATFFVVIVHVLQGAGATDARQLKVARMLSMRRRDVYRYVVVPGAMPEILIGLRQGLGVAWGGVIIAELVAGDKGLGAMEVLAQQSYDLDTLVVAMAAFAVLGLASVALFGVAERLAFPWLVALRRGTGGGTALPSPLAAGTSGSRTRRVGGAAVGVVIFVALWWAAGYWLEAATVVLPPPQQVAERLGELLTTQVF